MITAAKIIQNQKNILSERAKCTFCFVLIKQNLAQNVLRKGNNLFCRLYHSALLSQAASEWIEEHKQNKQYIV